MSFHNGRTLSTCWRAWIHTVRVVRQGRELLAQALRYRHTKQKCACWLAWIRGTSALWSVHAYVAILQQHKGASHSNNVGLTGVDGLRTGRLKGCFCVWKSSITAANLKKAVIQEKMHGLQLLLTNGAHTLVSTLHNTSTVQERCMVMKFMERVQNHNAL